MIKRLDINISISSVPHKHIQTISSTCAQGTNDFVMLMSCLLVAKSYKKERCLVKECQVTWLHHYKSLTNR